MNKSWCLTPEQKRNIVQNAKRGVQLRVMAGELGVSYHAVRGVLRRRGVKYVDGRQVRENYARKKIAPGAGAPGVG
jgi:hypothetical protein